MTDAPDVGPLSAPAGHWTWNAVWGHGRGGADVVAVLILPVVLVAWSG